MKQVRTFVSGLLIGAVLMSVVPALADSAASVTAYLRAGFNFEVNGEQVELQNTPLVYQDTTYLPVRELAGMLDHNVGFADNTISLQAKTPQAAAQRKDDEQVTTREKLQDIDTNTWVALGELRDRFGIIDIQTPDGNVTIQKGDLSFIITEKIHDRPDSGEFARTYGEYTIRVKYFAKGIFFNIGDLGTAGFIN